MKNKWYIVVLIFILAILGISSERSSAPNQELVIQFTDAEIASDKAQHTITRVKSQLEAVGVHSIKIQELGNGTLKITYYSDVEVSEIQKIFSESVEIASSHTSDKEDAQLPSEKELKEYQLDIYEIQNNNDFVGSNGNVLEAKSEIIRFFTPDSYATKSKQTEAQKNKIEKIAYICYKNIATAIDEAAYKIPEVRAGPTA
ncbi:hypothetical protein [uncultured Dokdonia sp.]|uniref:hypothetical protein n=1 Tax=uncultured Dokdonia sp. TaxID=575653 RepID=UPI00260AF0EF|nr:hypothetical protein [uncultured Dokdonia sp.]